MKYIKVTNDNVFIHDKSYCDVYNKDDCNKYRYFKNGLYLDNGMLLEAIKENDTVDNTKYQLMLDLVNSTNFDLSLDLSLVESIEADCDIRLRYSLFDVDYIRDFFNYKIKIAFTSKITYDRRFILQTLVVDMQKFKRVIAPKFKIEYAIESTEMDKPVFDLSCYIESIL